MLEKNNIGEILEFLDKVFGITNLSLNKDSIKKRILRLMEKEPNNINKSINEIIDDNFFEGILKEVFISNKNQEYEKIAFEFNEEMKNNLKEIVKVYWNTGEVNLNFENNEFGLNFFSNKQFLTFKLLFSLLKKILDLKKFNLSWEDFKPNFIENISVLKKALNKEKEFMGEERIGKYNSQISDWNNYKKTIEIKTILDLKKDYEDKDFSEYKIYLYIARAFHLFYQDILLKDKTGEILKILINQMFDFLNIQNTKFTKDSLEKEEIDLEKLKKFQNSYLLILVDLLNYIERYNDKEFEELLSKIDINNLFSNIDFIMDIFKYISTEGKCSKFSEEFLEIENYYEEKEFVERPIFGILKLFSKINFSFNLEDIKEECNTLINKNKEKINYLNKFLSDRLNQTKESIKDKSNLIENQDLNNKKFVENRKLSEKERDSIEGINLIEKIINYLNKINEGGEK